MKRFIIPILSLTLLVGCSGNGKNKGFQPSASGAPYELLVVVNKALWERDAGRALHAVLDSDVSFLPQSEPNFKLSVVDPAHFDNLLKPVRNIVLVDIDGTKYTQCRMSYSRNKWAAGQMVLTIKAPNEKEFAPFVQENKDAIVDFFVNSELNRSISLITETHNTEAKKSIQSMFGGTIFIPTELKVSKKADNFYWISNDGAKGRTDIVVYSVPYRSKKDLGPERMLFVRDSVMKANIPGGLPNSYMQTSTSIQPLCDTIGIRGVFCVRMAGLWEMHNDMMGGPFISHTILDKDKQQLITVEGFVFAPDMKKRNLIRRLQSVLYTFTLDEQKDKGQEMPINIPAEN